MNSYRNLLAKYSNRRPLLQIILDGYGIGKTDFTNGIYESQPAFLNNLFASYPSTQLWTHGKYVGLPGDKDMGGSEVGHMTLGAGQTIEQGAALIQKTIQDGSFFHLPVLQEALQRAKNNALHLIGLLSDGNVHSHIDHFFALLKAAEQQAVSKCYIHILLDGRDTPIQSALDYIAQLEDRLAKIRSATGFDYRIVSGGGREVITMDRDKDWQKVQRGYETHVLGHSGNNFLSATEAVEFFRQKTPDSIDQDLPPFNIVDSEGKVSTVKNDDSMIFVNFRSDRAIEFTRAMVEEDFKEFIRVDWPRVYFAGMVVYDEDTLTPANVLLQGAKVENPFGKRILTAGLQQFRLAETQKFPHVTFFYNGGYRNPLDPEKEQYIQIPSDRLTSFAQKPQMKAMEIADQAIALLQTKKYDFGLINFANPDMVGHTGDMEAVKIAIRAVDEAVKKLLASLALHKGIAIVTADHGNADEMLVENKKKGTWEPSTKHSLNPVPFVIYDPLFKTGDFSLKPLNSVTNNTLANVAATAFVLLGMPVPDDLEPALFE